MAKETLSSVSTRRAILGFTVVVASVGLWLSLTDRFYIGLVLLAAGFWVLTYSRSSARHRSDPTKEATRTVFLVTLVLWLFTSAMSISVVEGENPLLPDFIPSYAAGRLLLESPSDLYSLEAQLDSERLATGLDLDRKNLLPYAYFPFVALFFSPFTCLPFLSAYRLFTVVNLLLLGLTLKTAVSGLELDRDGCRVMSLFTVAFFPVYIALVQGQTTFFVMILVAWFVLLLEDSGSLRLGVTTGLLLFKPQFLILPLVLLLVRRRWKAVFACGAVVLALALVSLALVGTEGLRENLNLLGSLGRGEEFTADPLNMYNLRAVTWFFGLPDWAGLLAAVVAVGAVAVSAARTGGRWPLAALVLAMILVAPHSNPHDATIIILALALALSAGRQRTPFWKVLVIVVLAFCPVFTFLIWNAGGVRWPLVPVVLLIALGYSLEKARKSRLKNPHGQGAAA